MPAKANKRYESPKSTALSRIAAHPAIAWAGATLCALVLALNVFRLPFLWDDFDFLGRAVSLQLKDLLPDSSIVFYRPISREAYFWIVTHPLGASPLAAHVLNAVVAGGILAVLVALVQRLAGSAAALLAGLVFACSATLPLEIAWTSASQDQLCALFLLVSMYCQVVRKPLMAALAMAVALLSKETAVVGLPAIFLIAVARPDRSKSEIARTLAAQGVVLLSWASVHPWVRTVLGGTPAAAGSSKEYIAFRGGEMVAGIVRGAKITLNVPWIAPGPEWPAHLILPAAMATGLVLLLLVREKSRPRASHKQAEGGTRLAVLVGSLLFAGSIGLTGLLLGLWSPHYACIPAIGLSIVAGPALARVSLPAQVVVLSSYLWLGIGIRGNPFETVVPSEPNFAASAAALRKVESGFKLLYPSLPASNVYVSVQARGSGGIYQQLFRFQPLRVWYHQPGIWVLDPNRRRPGHSKEYLFWIDSDLIVYEIELSDLTPRSPTGQVDLRQYQKTLRGYSYGLASTGDVDRAVFILTNMPQTSKELWAFDRRGAAMLLYAVGRPIDAERVAATAPPFAQSRAESAVLALLAEPVAGLDLDVAAMRAFGLDPGDAAIVRSLMRQLEAKGFSLAASRFASRLQSLVPGDAESAAALERLKKYQSREITVAIPYDIPQ